MAPWEAVYPSAVAHELQAFTGLGPGTAFSGYGVTFAISRLSANCPKLMLSPRMLGTCYLVLGTRYLALRYKLC